MRIAFLLHNPNNPHSGAVRVYHVLAEMLRARGHAIELLYLEDVGLPSNKTADLLAQRTLLPRLVSRRAAKLDFAAFDVVMSSSGMAAPLFKRLRKRPTRPVLVNHLHGLFKYDHAANLLESQLGHWKVTAAYRAVTGPFQARWDAAGIESGDLTVVQNLRDLSEVRDIAGQGTPVTMIPPAVHPELFAASERVTPVEQRPATSLLYFGTWESRKGSYYVPAAFRQIREQRPEAMLTIGGAGRMQDRIRAEFDPRDRDAIIVKPRISNDEHAALMNGNAIFLFPSLSEGFGLALLEALCFGLAGVTTNTGFGADFLRDDVSAKLVFASSQHIARATLDLMENHQRRHDIARQGRDVARSLTAARMADAYEALFEQAVQSNRAAGRPPA